MDRYQPHDNRDIHRYRSGDSVSRGRQRSKEPEIDSYRPHDSDNRGRQRRNEAEIDSYRPRDSINRSRQRSNEPEIDSYRSGDSISRSRQRSIEGETDSYRPRDSVNRSRQRSNEAETNSYRPRDSVSRGRRKRSSEPERSMSKHPEMGRGYDRTSAWDSYNRQSTSPLLQRERDRSQPRRETFRRQISRSRSPLRRPARSISRTPQAGTNLNSRELSAQQRASSPRLPLRNRSREYSPSPPVNKRRAMSPTPRDRRPRSPISGKRRSMSGQPHSIEQPQDMQSKDRSSRPSFLQTSSLSKELHKAPEPKRRFPRLSPFDTDSQFLPEELSPSISQSKQFLPHLQAMDTTARVPLRQTNSNQQLLAQQSRGGYSSERSARWQLPETYPQMPVKLYIGGITEVAERSGVNLQAPATLYREEDTKATQQSATHTQTSTKNQQALGMHRGINAETPSATASFSSVNNVGRDVTTPALTHSPTKTSHDIKPNSSLTLKMMFEYGKFVVFIIARQSPNSDIMTDEEVNELFRQVKVEFKELFALSETTIFHNFYLIQRNLVEPIPMFGASLSKLDEGDENNFLQNLCRLKSGTPMFLITIGFEGLTVIISHWLDFSRSNKHLKIFIAVCERPMSRFDLYHRPEIWVEKEHNALFRFLVMPLTDLQSSFEGGDTTETVKEFIRISQGILKTRHPPEKFITMGRNGFSQGGARLFCTEDGCLVNFPITVNARTNQEGIVMDHFLMDHKKEWVQRMAKEDYVFQCGLWACPSFVNSTTEDPDEFKALSRQFFLHLRSHLKQVELFEFYCGEISFDLHSACQSEIDPDKEHWSKNSSETNLAAFVCQAEFCFASMRNHKTRFGLELHLRLMHCSAWDAYIESRCKPLTGYDAAIRDIAKEFGKKTEVSSMDERQRSMISTARNVDGMQFVQLPRYYRPVSLMLATKLDMITFSVERNEFKASYLDGLAKKPNPFGTCGTCLEKGNVCELPADDQAWGDIDWKKSLRCIACVKYYGDPTKSTCNIPTARAQAKAKKAAKEK